ncbi:MAG: acyl-CoA dehydrogenase [Pseudomonadota bacterium]
MDFDFTDDQQMLRDMTRRWVDKDYRFERRRAIVRGGGFDADAWTGLAELGLTGLVVPESHGGMALGAIDAMVVMEELGRGLVLEPFAQVALVAASLLRDAAPDAVRDEWLPRIADGSARVVLAHVEREGRYTLSHAATTAAQADGAWAVTGTKSLVAAGDTANAFIVPARTAEGGLALFLVERASPGVALRGHAMQDGSRAAELTLSAAPAVLLASADSGLAALEQAVDVGIAAVCAEAIGAMDAYMALTIDYLKTRRQFGVPIGNFQALRHVLADMKLQLELARSMSYLASMQLDAETPDRRRALSAAKLQLGRSMRHLGQHAMQLHGGIGMTDEYIGSHFFKRLTCIELSFGDSTHHLGELSALLA